MKAKSIFKTTALTVALSSMLVTGIATSAMKDAESNSTPTIQGYAPYLLSVGSRFVGKPKGEVFIGDIIEVPTSAFTEDSKFYAYRDGNDERGLGLTGLPPGAAPDAKFGATSSDLDPDNTDRVRPGQFLNQKVSVRWYIVKAKTDKQWADEIFKAANSTFTGGTLPDDFDMSQLNSPEYANAVKSWADIDIVSELMDETYYVPMADGSSKSLALRVPPEAAGNRVAFIIVPESQTGDPARGNPLKVPDLNFFYKQEPNKEPGEVCTVAPDDPRLDDSCNTNPGTPSEPNPDNGGGFVKLRNYMVNIRWSRDGSGVPTYDDAGRPIDPIVGTLEAPRPYVNKVYYAEISILTSVGSNSTGTGNIMPLSLPISTGDFRFMTDNEQKTISWELATIDRDALTGEDVPGTEKTMSVNWGAWFTDNAYDSMTKKKFIPLECNAAAKAAITEYEAAGSLETPAERNAARKAATDIIRAENCNPYAGHAFQTQLNNPEAQNFWGAVPTAVAPALSQPLALLTGTQEQSEQRMSIKVRFQYDDSGLPPTP